MSLRINDEAPDFSAETTQGAVRFHEWIGNGWAILFSHPKDFTPVCTTELGYMAGLEPEFEKRNCKIIGLSVDPVTSHSKWLTDIEETHGHKVNYPMIGDPKLNVAKLYNMLPADAGATSEGRTPATNATVRTVFVIGPNKKIKLMLSYPISTGRNFDEVHDPEMIPTGPGGGEKLSSIDAGDDMDDLNYSPDTHTLYVGPPKPRGSRSGATRPAARRRFERIAWRPRPDDGSSHQE